MLKEWNAAKAFDYKGAFREFTGIKEAFPTSYEKAAENDNKLCLHEESAERHITANGVNDEVVYRGCALSPSVGVQNPQRMDGR